MDGCSTSSERRPGPGSRPRSPRPRRRRPVPGRRSARASTHWSSRESLRGIETVIVDEVHALCATKRGAHLALSLERLDALLPKPAQRIGLSATVRPIDETARFLGGSAPVEVVAPPSQKTIEVSVVVPVPDMTELRSDQDDARSASIWPAVEERVLD